jgi:formylglycine-generating enzyme required for sulfatase activity
VKVLADRLAREPDASIRRAIVLSLGQFDEGRLLAVREQWVARLLELYRDDPDAGVHSAADWVLRQWRQEPFIQAAEQELIKDQRHRQEQIRQALARDQTRGAGSWYVNRPGQTMVVLAAPGEVEFEQGTRHMEKRRIDWNFALATKNVTVEQIRKCPRFQYWRDSTRVPIENGPVQGMSWFEAAEYCNWLSEQEGLPKEQWCYLPNGQGKFAEGMKLAPNHQRLQGYRLPSEAEWEYACRAGTVTAWSCGNAEDLLEKYAWYGQNESSKAHPVGALKPNDLGFFDMHGDLWQWCQDTWDGKEDKEGIKDEIRRVLRGGSGFEGAGFMQWHVRSLSIPSNHPARTGWRLARTFP